MSRWRWANSVNRRIATLKLGASPRWLIKHSPPGKHAPIYSSREVNSTIGQAGDLAVAALVSQALVDIVRSITQRPGFAIAKGGITSSDLAVRGLGVRRATILGQAGPGIPVWRLGEESTQAGTAYVVFPGNVGTPQTLRDLISSLSPRVPPSTAVLADLPPS